MTLDEIPYADRKLDYTPGALSLLNDGVRGQGERNQIIEAAERIARAQEHGMIGRYDVADAMYELGVGVERRVEA